MEKSFLIRNKLGLHLRAAGQFVKVASPFAAEIRVRRGSSEVNGKSIMGLATLAAGKGTSIVVITEGRDESEAMAALEKLIENKFGEE